MVVVEVVVVMGGGELPGFQFELLSLLSKPLRGFGWPCDFTQDDPGQLIWPDLQNLQQKIVTCRNWTNLNFLSVHLFKEIHSGSLLITMVLHPGYNLVLAKPWSNTTARFVV